MSGKTKLDLEMELRYQREEFMNWIVVTRNRTKRAEAQAKYWFWIFVRERALPNCDGAYSERYRMRRFQEYVRWCEIRIKRYEWSVKP